MNHCLNCYAKIGDFYLHCEPSAAFYPVERMCFDKIVVKQIDLPLSVSASTSESELTAWLQRKLELGEII